MARTNQKPAPQPHQAPDFLAWHVTQKGEKSFWNKVGAAWAHKDSKGFTLQLEVLPINGRTYCASRSTSQKISRTETKKGRAQRPNTAKLNKCLRLQSSCRTRFLWINLSAPSMTFMFGNSPTTSPLKSPL